MLLSCYVQNNISHDTVPIVLFDRKNLGSFYYFIDGYILTPFLIQSDNIVKSRKGTVRQKVSSSRVIFTY